MCKHSFRAGVAFLTLSSMLSDCFPPNWFGFFFLRVWEKLLNRETPSAFLTQSRSDQKLKLLERGVERKKIYFPFSILWKENLAVRSCLLND